MRTQLGSVLGKLQKLHVAEKDGKKFKAIELTGVSKDTGYLGDYLDWEASITGDGSRKNPYVLPASSHSPFLCFIAVWLNRRKENGKFIEMNDWFLKITPTGLRADDGVLTRLKPLL